MNTRPGSVKNQALFGGRVVMVRETTIRVFERDIHFSYWSRANREGKKEWSLLAHIDKNV